MMFLNYLLTLLVMIIVIGSASMLAIGAVELVKRFWALRHVALQRNSTALE